MHLAYVFTQLYSWVYKFTCVIISKVLSAMILILGSYIIEMDTQS